LNLLQKIVLLSCVEKDKEEALKIQRALLDSLKLYINPAIFKQEMTAREMAEGPVGGSHKGWDKVNQDFDNQSKTNALLGHPELCKPLAEAVANFYQRQASGELGDETAVPFHYQDKEMLG
jgi:hypothetical protein